IVPLLMAFTAHGHAVMVSQHDEVALFGHHFHAFVGKGTVAHDVAETNLAFDAIAFHGIHDLGQGFHVAVNVRENPVFHYGELYLTATSSTKGRFVSA